MSGSAGGWLRLVNVRKVDWCRWSDSNQKLLSPALNAYFQNKIPSAEVLNLLDRDDGEIDYYYASRLFGICWSP
jgi:hypothetical protein